MYDAIVIGARCAGSPAGNGAYHGRFLRPGDVMEGEISGLGLQRNRCIAESDETQQDSFTARGHTEAQTPRS